MGIRDLPQIIPEDSRYLTMHFPQTSQPEMKTQSLEVSVQLRSPDPSDIPPSASSQLQLCGAHDFLPNGLLSLPSIRAWICSQTMPVQQKAYAFYDIPTPTDFLYSSVLTEAYMQVSSLQSHLEKASKFSSLLWPFFDSSDPT
jgi:hypothetical protein